MSWDPRPETRRALSAEFSPTTIELAVMRAAWRVRDVELAAERYMDNFIAERQAVKRRSDPFVVDGEVLNVRIEFNLPTWPSW